MVAAMESGLTLAQLGWRHYFQQQLSLADYQHCLPARVMGQERSLLRLETESGNTAIPILPSMPTIAVGDWLLLDNEGNFVRPLERFSLFTRKAAGSRANRQLIAANIDTLFIVSSMNLDFNLNRLERYLAMAHEAEVEPVVVLTRLDLCRDAEIFVTEVRGLGEQLQIVPINSCDAASVRQLEPWCQAGQTIAFLGSSGVGKSTLVNTLMGNHQQLTQAIREDDDKGRHTTTSRCLFQMPSGAMLLDTPGMRELQLVDVERGIEETFTEIAELAASCKFSDCQHQQEPGCAVREAITRDELDERRLTSYLKLKREQAFNTATLAEKRASDRAFGKHVRSVIRSKNQSDF